MARNDPGSKSAINKGCTCPVLDNARGRGIPTVDGQRVFWISADCPLHTDPDDYMDDPEEELLDKYLLPRV